MNLLSFTYSRLVIAIAAAAWGGIPVLAAPPERIETSLAEWACRPPEAAIAAMYAQRDLGVVRCPAPAGFTLLLVSSNANSWIDLRRSKSVWSSEDAVVYRQGAGMFPNVTGRVVWLRGTSGDWRGLVFSIASRDEDDARHLAFFAVKTIGTPCLIGVFPVRIAAESALRRTMVCPNTPP